MFHPWRALRSNPHIDVHWTDQPPGLIASTDGRSRIFMDTRLLQVQRRCAATHELIHIERGHTRECSPGEELSVRVETAHRLIGTFRLMDVMAWTESWEEAAEELWVTVEVFMDRLASLTKAERTAIQTMYEQTEGGA
ncbi:ImmA/IrrE family metallo-endopeptidase [Pseudactinotalea sp. Z1732]|uniref:ImmA/IrrE family metallo-endopeptidase n=1 Tax=Micrococcales TaxID=85006 RepID=UPI003C7AB0B9